MEDKNSASNDYKVSNEFNFIMKKFLFVSVIAKYLKSSNVSRDLLHIFIL
jgi:hypothetical protein